MLFICVCKFVHNTNVIVAEFFFMGGGLNLNSVLFEVLQLSFVIAFQIAHDSFIVVILAHHNGPQSGGRRLMFRVFICY